MTRTEHDRPAAPAASDASQAAIKRENAQAGHTPWPWSIYFNSQDDLVIRKMFPDGQESHSIARCHSGAANARLIAAAPELLEAAKLVLKWYEAENNHSGTDFYQRMQMCRDSEDAIRAAIAKATGEQT